MKRLVCLLAVLLISCAALPVGSHAANWKIVANPEIELSPSSPVIDGVINDNEGWSKKASFDEDTAGYFQFPFQFLTGVGDMYFAISDEGLYFAIKYVEQGAGYCVKFYDEKGNGTHIAFYADPNSPNYTAEPGKYPEYTPDGYHLLYYRIDDYTLSCPDGVIPEAVFWRTSTEIYGTLNTVEKSTDVDYLDMGAAGWNGDVFALSLDPLSLFNTNGYDRETAPLYCFTIFDDDTVRVARTNSHNDGEITELCTAAGKMTDSEMVIEALIPWTKIIEDLNTEAAALGFDHTFTKEEILADGAEHRAAVTFYDRLYSNEVGDLDTCGRYIIACEVTDAGQPGYLSDGETFDAMGLRFRMKASSGGDESQDVTDSAETSGQTADSTSGTSTDTKGPTAVTTKAASTGNRSSNNSSASTSDAGIAVFVGIMAVSAIAAAYTAKKPRR